RRRVCGKRGRREIYTPGAPSISGGRPSLRTRTCRPGGLPPSPTNDDRRHIVAGSGSCGYSRPHRRTPPPRRGTATAVAGAAGGGATVDGEPPGAVYFPVDRRSVGKEDTEERGGWIGTRGEAAL